MKPFSSQWPPVMPIAWPAFSIRGPGTTTVVDRLAQRHVVEVGRADVANARESGEQRLARVRDADERRVARDSLATAIVAERIGERAPDDVRVRVDEAGQQRRVAEVDRLRAPAGIVTCDAAPAARILSCRTTTTPFRISAAPVPSMSRAALIAMTALVVSPD